METATKKADPYRAESEPHLCHALSGWDLQLNLVLVLGKVDFRCHLTSFQVDLK